MRSSDVLHPNGYLQRLPTAVFLQMCQFLQLDEMCMLPVLSREHFDKSGVNRKMFADACKRGLITSSNNMALLQSEIKWQFNEIQLDLALVKNAVHKMQRQHDDERNPEVKYEEREQPLQLTEQQQSLLTAGQLDNFRGVILGRLEMQRVILTTRRANGLAAAALVREAAQNHSLESSPNRDNKSAIGIGCSVVALVSGGITYAITGSLLLGVCCAGAVGILLLMTFMAYSVCNPCYQNRLFRPVFSDEADGVPRGSEVPRRLP